MHQSLHRELCELPLVGQELVNEFLAFRLSKPACLVVLTLDADLVVLQVRHDDDSLRLLSFGVVSEERNPSRELTFENGVAVDDSVLAVEVGLGQIVPVLF